MTSKGSSTKPPAPGTAGNVAVLIARVLHRFITVATILVTAATILATADAIPGTVCKLVERL